MTTKVEGCSIYDFVHDPATKAFKANLLNVNEVIKGNDVPKSLPR